MSFEAAFNRNPSPARDREVIRVDFARDNFGITAALRQAFAAAANDSCDRDFEKLLNELN
jgi:hypothetical protein